MSEKNIVQYSKNNLPEPTPEAIARFKKLKNMRDEDIDFSDIPEITDEMWETAEIVRVPKKGIYIKLDEDVLDFFKSQGKGYQTRINAVLKHFVKTQHRKKRKKVTT